MNQTVSDPSPPQEANDDEVERRRPLERLDAWLCQNAPLFMGAADEATTGRSLHGRFYPLPALAAFYYWELLGGVTTKGGLCWLFFFYCAACQISMLGRSRRRVDCEWERRTSHPTFLSIGVPSDALRRLVNRSPRTIAPRWKQNSQLGTAFFWRGIRVSLILYLFDPAAAAALLFISAVTPKVWVTGRRAWMDSGRATSSKLVHFLDATWWW